MERNSTKIVIALAKHKTSKVLLRNSVKADGEIHKLMGSIGRIPVGTLLRIHVEPKETMAADLPAPSRPIGVAKRIAIKTAFERGAEEWAPHELLCLQKITDVPMCLYVS